MFKSSKAWVYEVLPVWLPVRALILGSTEKASKVGYFHQNRGILIWDIAFLKSSGHLSCRILLFIFDRKPYFCDEPESAGIVWSEVTFIFNRADSQFIFLSIDKIQRWEEANEMRKKWFGRKATVQTLNKFFVEKIRFFVRKINFRAKRTREKSKEVKNTQIWRLNLTGKNKPRGFFLIERRKKEALLKRVDTKEDYA